MTRLFIHKLYKTAHLPKRATQFSAGLDMHAYITNGHITVHPGETKLIPTGLQMRPEEEYCIKLFPRSGLALKGVTLGNCVGLGDSDYGLDTCSNLKVTVHQKDCPAFDNAPNNAPNNAPSNAPNNAPNNAGQDKTCTNCKSFTQGPEYKVIIHNHGSESYTISHGERICQIKVERVEPTEIVEVNTLPQLSKASTRSNGFGHTGKYT